MRLLIKVMSGSRGSGPLTLSPQNPPPEKYKQKNKQSKSLHSSETLALKYSILFLINPKADR